MVPSGAMPDRTSGSDEHDLRGVYPSSSSVVTDHSWVLSFGAPNGRNPDGLSRGNDLRCYMRGEDQVSCSQAYPCGFSLQKYLIYSRHRTPLFSILPKLIIIATAPFLVYSFVTKALEAFLVYLVKLLEIIIYEQRLYIG